MSQPISALDEYFCLECTSTEPLLRTESDWVCRACGLVFSRRYVWDTDVLRFTEPLELFPHSMDRQREKQEIERKMRGEIHDV